MGLILIIIALVLPILAGILWWPWWTIPISAAVAGIGFYVATKSRIEVLPNRGGVPRAVGSALLINIIACVVLFELGYLLRHL